MRTFKLIQWTGRNFKEGDSKVLMESATETEITDYAKTNNFRFTKIGKKTIRSFLRASADDVSESAVSHELFYLDGEYEALYPDYDDGDDDSSDE